MEKSLTAAARVGRKLKSGRPREVPIETMDALHAVYKLVGEANKARALMKVAGLDPNDIGTGLVYGTPEDPEMKAFWQRRWLPPLDESRPTLEQSKPFFDEILGLALKTNINFYGIIWRLVDREANPGRRHVNVWLTAFMGGPEAEKALLGAKAHYEQEIQAGKPLDN